MNLKNKQEIIEKFGANAKDTGSAEVQIAMLTKKISELGGDFTNDDRGLFYSDYLTIFLLLRLNNSEKNEGVVLRMAEVIQANMRKLTDDSKSLKDFQKLRWEME